MDKKIEQVDEGMQGKEEGVEEPKNNTQEPKEEKVITQSEMDEIIARRLARERKKYEDYDDLKAQLVEIEEAKEKQKKAEMSEVERLQAELEEKAKAEEELANKVSEMKTHNKQQKIKSEFVRKASANGIEYIDAATKLANMDNVELDEEGNVVGMDEVISELVENNPFLIKEEKKPKQIGGGTNVAEKDNDKTAEQLLAEAAEKAQRTGLLKDRAAFAKLKRRLNK